MEFSVDGRRVIATTGDGGVVPGRQAAMFVHGAGLDRTVWALQARNPAFSQLNVLAVDLPGHGRSDGPALPSIEAMADWLVRVLDAADIASAHIVGHSMGALIALDLAGRVPARVARLALLGIGLPMRVAPALLEAALQAPAKAADMIVGWGFADRLATGPAPGLSMTGFGRSLLVSAAPGVLHADLAACNAYTAGLDRAADITAPTLLLLGARDRMTHPKGAGALAEALASVEKQTLPGAGHMMMSEAPGEVTRALATFLGSANPG